MKAILQIFLGDFISKTLVGVIGLLLINSMTAADFAQFTLATAWIGIISDSFPVGFNRVYIVAKQKLNVTITPSSILGLELFLIILLSFGCLFYSPQLVYIYDLVLAVSVLATVCEFSKVFYQEKLKFGRSAMVELMRNVLFFVPVILMIFIFKCQLHTWMVLLIQAISLATVACLALSSHIDFKAMLNLPSIFCMMRKTILNEYKYFLLYYLVLAIVGRIDVLMIKKLAGDYALATYGSALRYYGVLVLVLGSINVVYLPVMQKAESLREIRGIFKNQTVLILCLCPIIIIGAYAAKWIVPIIDKGKYPDAIQTFQVLAISVIISITCSPYVTVIIRFYGFKFLLFVTLAAAIICIAVNAVLIPKYGPVGAATATLVTFGCINIPIFFKARSMLNDIEAGKIEINGR